MAHQLVLCLFLLATGLLCRHPPSAQCRLFPLMDDESVMDGFLEERAVLPADEDVSAGFLLSNKSPATNMRRLIQEPPLKRGGWMGPNGRRRGLRLTELMQARLGQI